MVAVQDLEEEELVAVVVVEVAVAAAVTIMETEQDQDLTQHTVDLRPLLVVLLADWS